MSKIFNVFSLATMSTVLLATNIVMLGFVDRASAAECTLRNVERNDSNGGVYNKSWTMASFCPHAPNAAIYGSTNTSVRVGIMRTTQSKPQSWFVCYARGELHKGGNNIWYYTRANMMVDYPKFGGWGFMPANNVYTMNDPEDSKLPYC